MSRLQKNMVRTAISLIGTENLSKNLNSFLLPLVGKPDNIQLQPNENEIIGIFKNKNNEMYIERVSINLQGEIIRRFEEIRVTDFINNALKELENE